VKLIKLEKPSKAGREMNTIREEISGIDKTIQHALYLTWTSCKNFDLLNNTQNKQLLNDVWASIKSKVNPFFEGEDISFNTITKDIKDIILTVKSTSGQAYSPVKNVFEYNLWSLFFTIDGTDAVTLCYPWQLASELVHEYDHFLFARSFGIVGANPEIAAKFRETHSVEGEIRAYTAQRDFLLRCQKKATHYIKHQIQIQGWDTDGRPFPTSLCQCVSWSKDEAISRMKFEIDSCEKNLQEIKKGDDYYGRGFKTFDKNNRLYSKLLGLKIEVGNKDSSEVRLEM